MRFRDVFTGTLWEIHPSWQRKVLQHIAPHLRRCLENDLKHAADSAARFWRDTYYQWLFPLRFGLRKVNEILTAADLFPTPDPIRLDAAQPLRTRFLDREHLPPLLPAPSMDNEEVTELLADRLLSQAALANVLLRQAGVPPDLLHAARLALLTYPLADDLEDALQRWPQALRFVHFLNHRPVEPPPPASSGRSWRRFAQGRPLKPARCGWSWRPSNGSSAMSSRPPG
ncbi:MAG TPA: hypothetical protein VNK89_07635 [Thermoflexus sp.]|nr:hypothetical protein [Thermoflexus sp.]